MRHPPGTRFPRTFALVGAEAVATENGKERTVITFREACRHVLAETFQPFRVLTAGGRAFEVRDPDSVWVGISSMTVYAPPENDPDGPERREDIPYSLIESIAPLNAPANTGGR